MIGDVFARESFHAFCRDPNENPNDYKGLQEQLTGQEQLTAITGYASRLSF
jgi:hypothetical protein